MESFHVSSYVFPRPPESLPGPPDTFPGPPDTFPGPPTMFPRYIGPIQGLPLMEIVMI